MGSFCIFVVATVQIICFGWVWGLRNGAAELDQGALIKIPRFFLFVMKYIAPAYLLVVLVGYAAQENHWRPGGTLDVGDNRCGDCATRRGSFCGRTPLARGWTRHRRAGTIARRIETMNGWGWLFMSCSLALVWGTTIWAYYRLLSSPPEKPPGQDS